MKMMKSSIAALIWVLGLALAGSAWAQAAVRPFECEGEPAPRGRIDELVFGKLRQLGIKPARGCSDEVFVRRVYLDVIGTLPTAGQQLHLLNSSHVRQKIEQGPKLQALLRAGNKEGVTELYLTILSRFPTQEDLQVVTTQASGGFGKGLSNLAWALINSPESLYRH